MKQVTSLLGISILLGACCSAQPVRDALVFLTQLRDASQAQDAVAYAALCDSNGKWDGPFAQNAIGPLNIRAAVGQFFTEFGPLREVQRSAVQLSPDLVMADLYQMTKDRHVSLDPKLIASGSGTPPAADVRTTLILRKQESGWKIIATRVAAIRAENRRWFMGQECAVSQLTLSELGTWICEVDPFPTYIATFPLAEQRKPS